MAQIPIVHNLHQEFVLYVSIVDTEHTMDEVCRTAAQLSIGFEKNQQPDAPLRVRKVGAEKPFPRDMTVAEAGITPMTSLELFYEAAESASPEPTP